MKYVLIITLIITKTLVGQDLDTTAKFDLFALPSSPAANLLDIAPSEINTPSDPSEFLLALQSNTNNFTSLPNSFAIEMAPKWLFSGKKKYKSLFISPKKYSEKLWQSLTISAGVKSTLDSLINQQSTQTSLGFKLSFLRGDTISYDVSSIKKLRALLEKNNTKFEKLLSDATTNDSLYLSLEGEARKAKKAGKDTIANNYLKRMSNRKEELRKNISKRISSEIREEAKEMKKIAQKIKFRRYGPKLDFAGGVVLNFPNQQFNKVTVSKAGLWLVGGYEIKNDIAFLGIVRYLYNPNQAFSDSLNIIQTGENLHGLDFGAKIAYMGRNNKFSGSAEAVYRLIVNNNQVTPGWKVALNLEYSISKAIKVNLALGKDFNGNISKQGNVIALLSLFTGIGNSRPMLQ